MMFGGLFRRSREETEMTVNTRVSCTQRGAMKARDYSSGNFEYEVLREISVRGNPTIGELAEEVNKPVDRVKEAIKRLRGLVIVQEDMSEVRV